MDAMTTNGIKYGAAVEIRTNMNGTQTNASASANSGAQTFYIRRAYGYVGTDAAGTVRFGQIDGPLGLMKVGDMQTVGDGGVNGDVPDFTPSIVGAWQFPFSVGAEYAQNKIIYLSPSFAGFDFGISFAPSTSALLGSIGSAATDGPSASTFPGDHRGRNFYELNARYRGTFSGVGLAANVGYMGSGRVNGGGPINYKGMSVVDAGLAATFMNITVGGHMSTGKFNGQASLSASGEKDAMLYIVGANYDNGVYTLGGHYYNGSRPGVIGNGAAKKDSVFAAGATWNWAPGAQLLAEVMTGSEKEGPIKNSATGLVIGQAFRW
jgi:hypothetical protein